MRRIHLAAVWTAALVMLAAASGCSSGGGGSSSSTPTATATSGSPDPGSSPSVSATSASPLPSPTAAAMVKTASAGSLGTILVNGHGRTLYLFEADKSTTSTCTGACTAVWPPLLTAGAPTAGGSAKSNLLGTSKRSDGLKQVTYNGHPVYMYSGDTKAGDTNGQGLNQFGALWYVLDTNGNKVDKS